MNCLHDVVSNLDPNIMIRGIVCAQHSPSCVGGYLYRVVKKRLPDVALGYRKVLTSPSLVEQAIVDWSFSETKWGNHLSTHYRTSHGPHGMSRPRDSTRDRSVERENPVDHPFKEFDEPEIFRTIMELRQGEVEDLDS